METTASTCRRSVTMRGVEGVIELAPAVGIYSIAMPSIYLLKL